MTAADLLARLREQGCRLRLAETEAGLVPRLTGKPSAEDRAALAEHREAVIALLLAEARAATDLTDRPDPEPPRFHEPLARIKP